MADDSISQLRRAAAAAVPPPPAKPLGGARLLSFLLQAFVMSVALSLFFLFAGFAALVLLHLLVAGRAFRRRRQLAFYNPLADDDTVAGLCAADLCTLPCFDFCPGCEVIECAVCLEGLKRGERCRALPGCGHVFHEACVDRWLVLRPACPVCRGGVLRTVKRRWL